MRDFAWPRRPRRMKLCLERTALMIWGTTVSSYPTMPGKSGAFVFADSRSLAMRFSRSSSLTLRARRAGVNSLARRALSVAGREVAMVQV